MHVTQLRTTRLAAAALALLFAATAQAQLKTPHGAGRGSSTGLKASSPSSAPATAPASAPAPASTPATAPQAAASQAGGSSSPDTMNEQEKAAANVAAGWLTLLDRRDWGTAWETSAGMFRSAVPLDKWMDGIPKVRKDLGALVERAPASVSEKHDLPGRPKGDYVTVLFTSKYEQRTIDEIVTTVREPDGRWRVSGYSTR